MLTPAQAVYLDEDDIVFGMYINGIAKAYPKRILAWHEFVVDDFEDAKIAGVYCTLCGTVIAYDMTVDSVFHNLGTSGFLYRSNKLMYDRRTQSLWSTIEGKPVIGPLVDQDIHLESYPVVTTTWEEWKALHPETLVLDINTGHNRNYDKGQAYKEYFSTDELMFPVPDLNDELNNKDEVFVLRTVGSENDPLAISIKFLKRTKFIQTTMDGSSIIILSSQAGAARAYQSDNVQFSSYKKGILLDSNNNRWEITEDHLISPHGQRLNRLVGHNIFWFAWYSAYPEGKLIK